MVQSEVAVLLNDVEVMDEGGDAKEQEVEKEREENSGKEESHAVEDLNMKSYIFMLNELFRVLASALTMVRHLKSDLTLYFILLSLPTHMYAFSHTLQCLCTDNSG